MTFLCLTGVVISGISIQISSFCGAEPQGRFLGYCLAMTELSFASSKYWSPGALHSLEGASLKYIRKRRFLPCSHSVGLVVGLEPIAGGHKYLADFIASQNE